MIRAQTYQCKSQYLDRTCLGKEADGYGVLSSECPTGEVEVERVGTRGLGGSGLNWESGVGAWTKVGGRALEGAEALWERRYVAVGHG